MSEQKAFVYHVGGRILVPRSELSQIKKKVSFLVKERINQVEKPPEVFPLKMQVPRGRKESSPGPRIAPGVC